MRPVDRGAAPTTYSKYGLALQDLQSRIGTYCSYCERPFGGAVEHVLPKAVHTGLELTWANFLVACTTCNSIKRNQQVAGSAASPAAARALYLWPDTDNTARAFVYTRTSIAEAPALGPPLAQLARDTLSLTGFHRIPGTHHPTTSPKDLRWLYRKMAWDLADKKLLEIQADPAHLPLRTTTAELAAATGFWSVWRAVFAADSDMLLRFNAAFKGTDPASFDTNGQPIPRPGGRL